MENSLVFRQKKTNTSEYVSNSKIRSKVCSNTIQALNHNINVKRMNYKNKNSLSKEREKLNSLSTVDLLLHGEKKHTQRPHKSISHCASRTHRLNLYTMTVSFADE